MDVTFGYSQTLLLAFQLSTQNYSIIIAGDGSGLACYLYGIKGREANMQSLEIRQTNSHVCHELQLIEVLFLAVGIRSSTTC